MKLRYTKRALQQINTALAYVHDRSPQGADAVRVRLATILRLLQRYPYAGHPTSRAGVMRMSISPYPYVVDYRVVPDAIVVQRFRHTSRRPLS